MLESFVSCTKYVQIINTVNDFHDNECQNIPYETNKELMLFWKYKIIKTKNEKYTLYTIQF